MLDHKAVTHTLPFPAMHQLALTPATLWDRAGTVPRLLGTGLSPDLLRAHVLVGQINMQQWLCLILESLPAVNLLNTWDLLFDLFPEPIRQPEDLGKSQRAHARERGSRELAFS